MPASNAQQVRLSITLTYLLPCPTPPEAVTECTRAAWFTSSALSHSLLARTHVFSLLCTEAEPASTYGATRCSSQVSRRALVAQGAVPHLDRDVGARGRRGDECGHLAKGPGHCARVPTAHYGMQVS